MSDDLIVIDCDYSLNELKKVADELNLFMKKNKSVCLNLNFYGFGLQTDLNRIVVRMGDCSNASIAKFKSLVMDDDCISFSEGEMMTSDADPGGTITSGQKVFSVGYRAKRNGEEGIVTAGHAILVNERIKEDGNDAGVCTISMTSGSVDAAFCKTRNTPSRVSTYWDKVLSTKVGIPIVGASITMEGTITQKNGLGSIISIWETRTYKANNLIYTLTDMCTASYKGKEGDSGGIVYDNSTSQVIGIHTGHDNISSSFTKASNINSSFVLTMY